MDADAIATIWPELDRTLTKHLEVTNRLLEQVTYLTDRNEKLERELELLGDRIGLVHAQTIVRDNALGEQVEQLDERLTTVHKAALRALNLKTGGSPAA